MKKIYSSLFIVLMAGLMIQTSFAQRFSVPHSATSVALHDADLNGFSINTVTDTLKPPSFNPVNYPCDSVPAYYVVDAVAPYDSGYAFGNNIYGEIECAQKYYATGSVTGVLVGIAHANGTGGITKINIYSIDGVTKGPSATILGTSNTVLTDSLTAGYYMLYTFGTSVSVTTSFAASVVFPTVTGDTKAIYTTPLDCASSDSLSYENFPLFGGWGNTLAEFGHNLDFYILPIIDIATGVNGNYPFSKGLTMKGVYPNPASSGATISYSVDKATQTGIEVFDLRGRKYSTFSGSAAAGDNQFNIDVKDMAAGTYFYTIRTGETSMTSKFDVVK